MTRQSLEGKVALVTAAAGGGMGRVIAKRFGEEGATIVVTDAHERRVMETAEALSKELNQKVLGMKLDVRSQADIDACVGEVLKVHGHMTSSTIMRASISCRPYGSFQTRIGTWLSAYA